MIRAAGPAWNQMRRLLLLATTLLALNSPANANSWVRTTTPADSVRAQNAGLWVIEDMTDSLGDLYGIGLNAPSAMSERGGTLSAMAWISTWCFFRGFPMTTIAVASGEDLVVPPNVSLLAKVDGVRYGLSVFDQRDDQHEFGFTNVRIVFLTLEESGLKLLRKAIKEELPVKIAVPIYQEPDEVFEWNMEGGAAAFAVFEEECSRKP